MTEENRTPEPPNEFHEMIPLVEKDRQYKERFEYYSQEVIRGKERYRVHDYLSHYLPPLAAYLMTRSVERQEEVIKQTVQSLRNQEQLQSAMDHSLQLMHSTLALIHSSQKAIEETQKKIHLHSVLLVILTVWLVVYTLFLVLRDLHGH